MQVSPELGAINEVACCIPVATLLLLLALWLVACGHRKEPITHAARIYSAHH
jgi:hypothetical protein